jgi:molecular chaperone GrpE
MTGKKKDHKAPTPQEPAPEPGSAAAQPAAEGAAPQPEESAAIEAQPMVALSLDEYDALQNDLERLRSDAKNSQEGWQRERADFINYKRRVERDSALVYQNALASILKKYLAVSDDLDRALRNTPQDAEVAAWSEGIVLIQRKLLALLEAEGVTQMNALGEMFDPIRHEAVAHEDSPDHQSGQIIDVLQPGYLLADRVIRPAVVRVAR